MSETSTIKNEPASSNTLSGSDTMLMSTKGQRYLRLAIAGCSHGEMDRIYDTLAHWEQQSGQKYDLLICCGDFQAIRNYGDLHHMKVPDKHKKLMTFYKYYSGEKEAPILTVFIGGNHESSGYLSELPYGGWVAPKIYYMGFSNVIRFAGLRIAGLSGIYKVEDFQKGHFERPPLDFKNYNITSAYHVRSLDMFKLKQLRSREDSFVPNPVDIMITHDWPAGITDYGDAAGLLRIKPYFEGDIQTGRLGNPAAMSLLFEIRPRYWFAAHMHCMFHAEVPHDAPDSDSPSPEPTKFLALDKPLDRPNPRRPFLDIVEIPISDDAQLKLEYDPAWLAILKNTDGFTEVTSHRIDLPSPSNPGKYGRWDYRPTDDEVAEVTQLFDGNFDIPDNFRQTAPPHQPTDHKRMPASLYYRNPQTTEFCKKLGIKDFNLMLCQVPGKEQFIGEPQYLLDQLATNPDEINVNYSDEDDKFGDDDFIIDTSPRRSPSGTIVGASTINPDSSSNSQINTTEVELQFDHYDNEEIIRPRCDGTPTIQREISEQETGGRVLKRRHVDIPDED